MLIGVFCLGLYYFGPFYQEPNDFCFSDVGADSNVCDFPTLFLLATITACRSEFESPSLNSTVLCYSSICTFSLVYLVFLRMSTMACESDEGASSVIDYGAVTSRNDSLFFVGVNVADFSGDG